MELQQENEIIFEPTGKFLKSYSKSWSYLAEKFNAIEFKAAFSLALMAKANTNSLEPLSDETTYKELITILDVDRRKVEKVLRKLFDYGVYAKFEVEDKTKPYTKFWILNPYLCFSRKLLKSDIVELFEGTVIALHYKGKLY